MGDLSVAISAGGCFVGQEDLFWKREALRYRKLEYASVFDWMEYNAFNENEKNLF